MKYPQFLLAIAMALVLVACGGGNKVETITSSNPVALFTSAPASLTFGQSAVPGVFAVGGGTAPYSASTSNNSVALASLSGATLTITKVAAGTAQIVVVDSTGTKIEIVVTVSASAPIGNLYTTAPSGVVTLASGGVANYLVGGGTPPYLASSSNPGVVSTTISGTNLTIAASAGGTAQVTVVDAVGGKVDITITVGSGSSSAALFTTAPSIIILPVGAINTYAVAGGNDPYAASSSNTGVASVVLTGASLKITGVSAGTAQVLVLDSVGTQVLIGVTVGGSTTIAALYTTAPSAVTVASFGGPSTYAIGGGAGGYTAASSNMGVVTVAVNGTNLSIQGVAAGAATVDISDSTGVKVSIGVTVPPTTTATPTALSVSPNGATGNVGDTLTFVTSGGSPAYSITVSNPSIASVPSSNVSTSGGTFTAVLSNVGNTIVTVADAQGQIESFLLTVGSVSSQLRVSPSAFVVGENELSAIALNIFGGTPPYRALTSDLLKSTVPVGSIAGNVLSTTVGSSTNRCINPVTADVPPVYIPSGTYDVTLTVVDSLGASATSIMTIQDNGAGLNAGCP